MSMVGANYEALEAGATRMRQAADELDAHSKGIQGTIGGLSWIGQVATAFVNMWNGGHRRQLASTAVFIREAAKELDSQARQQRYASEKGGEAWLSDALHGIFNRTPEQSAPSSPAQAPNNPGGGAPAPGGSAPAQPAPAGGGTVGAGATSGVLPNSNRDIPQVQAAYEAWMHGRFGPGGESYYQCTAWANFRWRELGYTGPDISGNGDQMAAWAGSHAGAPISTAPTLGAIGSFSAYNHVIVVEEIDPSGTRMRVSEMNVGDRTWQESGPDEYRTNWMVKQADGTWRYDGRGSAGAITFAAMPK